jgi:hypothetical protein
MSRDAGKACPYAASVHLVVVPHVVSALERHRALHELRLASVKTAVYLGGTAVRHTPANSASFESLGPVEASRPGLPRLAYIGQIHSRQRVAEVDEQILYGANTAGMAPVQLHPNEWLDGARVTSYFNRAVETYFYQNHPVIIELYRWHREGKITLVGTIATMVGSDNDDRARNAMLAAHQAKWSLAAEGIILTKYGGGAPHADMALTAKLCEELGMRRRCKRPICPRTAGPSRRCCSITPRSMRLCTSGAMTCAGPFLWSHGRLPALLRQQRHCGPPRCSTPGGSVA